MIWEDEEKIISFYDEMGGTNGFIDHIMRRQEEIDMEHMTKGPQYSFWAIVQPSISLKQYDDRLSKLIPFEKSTVVIACYYLNKLSNKGFFLHANNVHRFMVCAMLIARKYHEEREPVRLHRVCKAAGINVTEMMSLEIFFCILLDWELFCSMEDLDFFISCSINELHSEAGIQHVDSSRYKL